MVNLTENRRVKQTQRLPSPAEVKRKTETSLSFEKQKNILRHRREISNILKGQDSRLLIIVGPCSIHDTQAGLEYAQNLTELSKKTEKQLKIVMRTYFEKPRTQLGWKGLINDPYMDGTCRIDKGLYIARKFLHRVACHDNFAIATELLEPATPQYMSDLLAWGAIGARTVESQVHRQMASGMSFPVGFKNCTNGNLKPAIDGIKVAKNSHSFVGISEHGLPTLINTTGNNDCHLVLRGGGTTPNFLQSANMKASKKLYEEDLRPTLMIDCSHGNSEKNVDKQIQAAEDITTQIAFGNHHVCGLMLESFLKAGKQNLHDGEYGKSVTDPCIGWDKTEELLNNLAEAVEKRREKHGF